MSKISNSNSATLFQLELLKRIPKNRKITSAELLQQLSAAGFPRDLRTIQRTLVNLSEHFDIECDMQSKPYGFRWKPNSKGMDLPSLTLQQSLVLMLAEQQLKNLLPANILQSMQPFFDQARHQMIFDAKEKPEYQWLNKVAVAPTSQPLIPAQIDEEIFQKISTALFQNKMLNVHYQNTQGKQHQAQIKPLALVQQGPTCYLVAQYEDENIRHLALHRFLNAEISNFNFERPKTFNLKDYLANAGFGFPTNKKIRFSFSISQSAGFHLTETPLTQDQIMLEQSDEHYRFQCTLQESEMLDWWIAKFGEDIWDIEKEYLN